MICLYALGSPVRFQSELVSRDRRIFTLPPPDRIWDRLASFSVSREGFQIERLRGRVVFANPPAGSVIVSGAWCPFVKAAEFGRYNLFTGPGVREISKFGDTEIRRVSTAFSSAGILWDLSWCDERMMDRITQTVVIELHKMRTWATVSPVQLESLMETKSLEWQGQKDAEKQTLVTI